jgi:magnesium-protoporphyrin O-methyltransferase
MADFLDQRGLHGKTVLEVGGGVGEIQLELVKRGATTAVNLEISSSYEPEAARLISESGLTGRIHRRLLDIAADPASVETADVVVLHRVVCCYPDYERLLGAAADAAREALVFSHPPRNPVSRMIFAGQNALFWMQHRQFRTYDHPPAAMLDVLGRHGLRKTYAHRGPFWHVAGLERCDS